MRSKQFFLLLFFPVLMNAQLKKKALFLGNSYTYVNDLPSVTKQLALSKSDTLYYDQIVMGGYTFQNHFNNPQTYVKMKSDTWDVIIIQGQSQEPSFAPAQVMTDSYPYAKALADSARAANPCAEILFFMTWGRKNGDQMNCMAYPPICTYDGMQARLRETYLMFADSFNTSCAPVGVAWKTFRNNYPAVELYQGDESHPVAEGTYLAACVFYSSIFKKTPVGSTYYSGINQTVAQNMQAIAGPTVLDSTAVWNLNSQVPTANFSYSLVSGNTYQFTDLSLNASTYNWSFGSNQRSPQYTFAGTPPYTITLTAANGCTTNAISKTISLTEITENEVCKNNSYYDSQSNELKIKWCNNSVNAEINIYDLSGKKVRSFKNNGDVIELNDFEKGFYLVEVLEENKRTVSKIVR